MTREEYLKIYTDASYARVVNQIFNDHEAQLKEANRIKDSFRKTALDLDEETSSLRIQLKAKDEEVERLKVELMEAIAELEELMKPKSCELCAYSCEYKTNNYECNLLGYTDQDGTLSYIDVERNFYCKLFRLKV